MKNKCEICGVSADSNRCFRHKQKKPLKVNAIKKTNKSSENSKNIDEMKQFFLYIWKKRKHNSEVSGKWLGSEPLSVFFHHILPKSKYPEHALDEDNIILLTLDEHSNVENDMYKYEEVNKRRILLKEKYAQSKS